MNLHEELNSKRQSLHTDDYPMSIFEIASMYESGEVDIHPEFQRFYRWSDEQKSSLIESILLGLPLPSIFVYQRSDGVFDVIDGIQRLSTIFEFLGILKGSEGQKLPFLVLKKGVYLPSLEGKVWDASQIDGSDEELEAFPRDIKLFFRRSKIDVKILLRESDENAKFELFRRLNTGGTLLSDQEMRNCLIAMINSEFLKWLNDISSNESFVETIAVSERLELEQYDKELALRFVLLHNVDESEVVNIGDLGKYITDRAQEIAQKGDFKYSVVGKRFEEVFSLLRATLQDDAFRKYNVEKGRFMGGFSVSAFEMIAMGLGYRAYVGLPLPDSDVLYSWIITLWGDKRTDGIGGSGVRASTRIPKTLKLGREYFASE